MRNTTHDGRSCALVSRTSADAPSEYDRAYYAGPASQASYLCRALPARIAGGAAKVFVTLRDNLGGELASEEVIAAASAARRSRTRSIRRPQPTRHFASIVTGLTG
jgi:hypothetical protein